MKRLTIIVLIFFHCLVLYSQETIKVMSYNLLNFYNFTSYCTEANNPPKEKAKNLKTIIENQNPDILAACEVGTSNGGAQFTLNYILENSLNVNGETKWEAALPSGKGTSLNALFFDKTKFTLIGQPLILSNPRDINVYRLQYINSQNAEPIFFNIIVVHLKAGDSESNKQQRTKSANDIMNYINQAGNNNYIIAGDFNVYTSEEECFQKFVYPSSPANAFNDPIEQIGEWHENYDYREFHTQSTHSGGSHNKCWVGGGLDDRFDFILISNSIKNGTQKVKYKEDTYKAVGQDGNRFNQSINYPTNYSLPQNVITALANMSDHLPVVADFYFYSTNSIASESTDTNFYANITNPINEDFTFKLGMNFSRKLTISILCISGAKVFEISQEFMPNTVYKYNIDNLSNGMYIVNFKGKGISQSFRIIKNK